jgi:hypothetical protein
MNKFFCGVGSRETPDYICRVFTYISQELCGRGYTLRSGGADGADLAFENGARYKQIWLPWTGFNKSKSQFIFHRDLAVPHLAGIIDTAHWNRLSEGGRKLHSRNVHQVLGDLRGEPYSEFVLCWTENAQTIGGTATAIKLAKKFGIPVFNFGKCKTSFDAMEYWDQVKMFMELHENPTDS